jgi:uncharacterized repeat protein (TIGR01451 family)
MRTMRRLLTFLVAAAAATTGMVPVITAGTVRLSAPAPAAAASITPPIVRNAVAFDVSPKLVDLPPLQPIGDGGEIFEPEEGARVAFGAKPADPVRQTKPTSTSAMPAPNLTFEAERDADNFPFLVEPPDPTIDVGPNHVVQQVNSTFAVYDKQGNLLLGPVENNTLWQGFGVGSGDPAPGICAVSNAGDPIVQYDHLSDRWLLSQFAFSGGAAGVPTGPYYECIAVSATPDPLGAWNRYEFLVSATKFDDYPHIGVWPDGYYMSINQFDETTDFEFAGPGAVVFERDKMIAGQMARSVYFDLSTTLGPQYGGMLPSDLDGATPPPAGAPNTYAEADDDAFGFASDRLDLFNAHVDWADTAASSFSGPSVVNVAPFDSAFPCADSDGDGAARNCVPLKDGPGLDVISDRLMYRVAYRNIGGHETLVTNHTVDVNDTEGHAGVRWYELRKTATTPWGVYQQGTYAPDAKHRWMGSAAMDKAGDIAVGYSLSSATTNPAIAYAGRLAGDPLGQLAQGEVVMFQGTGSRIEEVDSTTGEPGEAGRWGDYTSLVLDPTNDCTFWYTNEYYETNGSFDWHTRVGSFTFPSCLGGGADLGVSTTGVGSTAQAGQRLTYTVTVANNGPSAASNVVLTDSIPSNSTFVSAAAGKTKCSGTTSLVCKIGTMPVGSTATVAVTVTAPSTAATLVNTATASSGKADPNPDNNTSKVTTQVVDTCHLPGALVADDTDDAAPNVSPVPGTDIHQLWVAEPHQADGVARVSFTVSLGGPGALPASSQWFVLWNRPAPDATYDRNYVAMKTDATGAPAFDFGSIAPPSANLPTSRGTTSGSYDAATGRFTISVANASIDGVTAGSALPDLQVRAFLARPAGGPISQAASTDFGPIVTYRLVGDC